MYLGFIVTTDGIEVDHDKVAAILQWGRPNTVKRSYCEASEPTNKEGDPILLDPRIATNTAGE
ncbi:uncharacterized protein ASPGLDRAFT_1511021, partial [Aspergillus glaucus CBS 516.65]